MVAAAALGFALALAPAAAQKADGPNPAKTAVAAAEPDSVTAPDEGTSETEAALQTHGDGVAAIVDDTVISEYDLRQRISLFLSTSGMQPTPDAVARIRPQVLRELETERLELLEAEKKHITVSSSEVDKAIQGILDDNHMTPEQLSQILSRAGVHIATLRAQITAQIAWSKTVQDQYGDRVDITPEDVSGELSRIAQSAHDPHFLASEIFEAVDTPEQDAKVQKDMENLEEQLHAGAPFAAVARQFSQSPTAAQGGELGWVTKGQLAPELEKVLNEMTPGEVSVPVRSAGGYYILYLRQRQEPVGTKIVQQQQTTGPQGTLPLMRILLPVGPNPPPQLKQNATAAANAMREHISDCSVIPQLVKALKGSVFMNLGNMKLDDLSKEIRDALANTQPGQTTDPFQSPAGIEIIARCDKPAPQETAFKMPSKEQIEEQLYEEQMSVLARRYMRDLKRDADIETRDAAVVAEEKKDAKIN